MAEKAGVTRAVYSNIERARNDGSPKFWETLQKAFDIQDEHMYALIKIMEVEK